MILISVEINSTTQEVIAVKRYDGINETLLKHWNTQELAQKLVAMGDCYGVADNLDSQKQMVYGDDEPSHCIPKGADSLKQFAKENWNISTAYLFKNGAWTVWQKIKGKQFKKLKLEQTYETLS